MSKKKSKAAAPRPVVSLPETAARAPLSRFAILCMGAAAGAVLGALDPLQFIQNTVSAHWPAAGAVLVDLDLLQWMSPANPSADQEATLRLICALMFAAGGAFVAATLLALLGRNRRGDAGHR